MWMSPNVSHFTLTLIIFLHIKNSRWVICLELSTFTSNYCRKDEEWILEVVAQILAFKAFFHMWQNRLASTT